MNKDIIYWKKGDVIYDIGDNPEAAFIINSGQVEIKSSEGIKVGIIKENEIFGDKACILGLKDLLKRSLSLIPLLLLYLGMSYLMP